MKRVRVSRSDIDQAVAGGVISVDQADALWAAWSAGASAAPDMTPRFSITHVLDYLGGLIAIGAMTLFMNLGWERFGPWALFAIAVAYGVGCILTSRSLAARGLMLPAGILATLAIVLVPLATWALQSAFGWWPPGGAGEHYRAYHTHIDWRWITLEFATLVAAVIGLWPTALSVHGDATRGDALVHEHGPGADDRLRQPAGMERVAVLQGLLHGVRSSACWRLRFGWICAHAMRLRKAATLPSGCTPSAHWRSGEGSQLRSQTPNLASSSTC